MSTIASIKALLEEANEQLDDLPSPGEPPAQEYPPAVNCLGGAVPSLPPNPFGPETCWNDKRTTMRDRFQHQLPDGAVICLGTSVTESWDVAQIHPACRKFGIGGDRLDSLLNRVGELQPCLSRAGAVILEIGVNDAGYVGMPTIIEHLDKLFGWLSGPLVVLDLIPSGIIWPGGGTPYLSQATMAAFNNNLSAKLAGRPNCQIVPVCDALRVPGGWMKPEYGPDLCHPNAEGYAVMRPLVQAGLASALI